MCNSRTHKSLDANSQRLHAHLPRFTIHPPFRFLPAPHPSRQLQYFARPCSRTCRIKNAPSDVQTPSISQISTGSLESPAIPSQRQSPSARQKADTCPPPPVRPAPLTPGASFAAHKVPYSLVRKSKHSLRRIQSNFATVQSNRNPELAPLRTFVDKTRRQHSACAFSSLFLLLLRHRLPSPCCSDGGRGPGCHRHVPVCLSVCPAKPARYPTHSRLTTPVRDLLRSSSSERNV